MKALDPTWEKWRPSDPRARFADLGGTAIGVSPADFSKLIAGQTEKWGKVVRAA
jgi:hypothetical protein